jgi:hypothetical protein
MSIEEVNPECLAILIHHYHETLAADFGCGVTGTCNWNELPRNERQRLIAAARLTLSDLADTGRPRSSGNEPNVFVSGPKGTEGKDWGC